MQPFDTLIKARKHELDEARRKLAILLDRQDRFRDQIADMDRRLEAEAQFARQHLDAAAQYPVFAEGARRAQAQWQEEIDKLQPAVDEAQDAVAEAFQDLKRLEITNDLKEEALRKEQAMKTQNELDEIGLNLHRRQRQS